MSEAATGMGRRPAALVTGAAAGLGREIALGLGRAGYDLFLADIDQDGMREVASHADVADGTVAAAHLDLRSEASIEAVSEEAWSRLDGFDLLVNNAGVTIHKPAFDLTWAEWDAVLDVNLKGAYFMAREFARRVVAARRTGSVVSIASAHGIVGFPDRSPYGISKAGIIHMTKMLGVEWAASGIRVNAVAPGTIMTPSRQELLRDPAARQRMLGRIPMGRFPDAEEVAAAVIYLASPAARSITGHTIVLDGGTTVA